MEEVLRISDRNAVVCDCKWVAEYPNSVDDQILIHPMAGEL
jgi:ABC-type sugar transport system ATPase subunit